MTAERSQPYRPGVGVTRGVVLFYEQHGARCERGAVSIDAAIEAAREMVHYGRGRPSRVELNGQVVLSTGALNAAMHNARADERRRADPPA